MNNKKDTLRAEFIEYVSKLTRHIRIDYLRRLQHRREYETPKEDLYQANSYARRFLIGRLAEAFFIMG